MKYFEMINEALKTVDIHNINKVIELLSRDTTPEHNPAIFFGNGGSAGIANHIVTDFTKGVYEDGDDWNFPCLSLCSNMELIFAIANDIGYDQIFSKQLAYLKFDAADVVAISSSGNSENIIQGLMEAEYLGYETIALVGFDGGNVVKHDLANTIIHVKSDNYGVIEDCHQIILHSICQEVRKKLSPNKTLRL